MRTAGGADGGFPRRRSRRVRLTGGPGPGPRTVRLPRRRRSAFPGWPVRFESLTYRAW